MTALIGLLVTAAIVGLIGSWLLGKQASEEDWIGADAYEELAGYGVPQPSDVVHENERRG